MDWYQKFLKWFNARTRWQQVGLIILLSLLFVVGIWLSDYSTVESTGAMVDSPAWILGVFLKLGVVLLLICGAAIYFRRWQAGSAKNNSRRMKIIESTALSPRRAIYLIQVDGQTYMVGATDQSVNLISEVESLELRENTKPPLFSEVLTKAGDLLE